MYSSLSPVSCKFVCGVQWKHTSCPHSGHLYASYLCSSVQVVLISCVIFSPLFSSSEGLCATWCGGFVVILSVCMVTGLFLFVNVCFCEGLCCTVDGLFGCLFGKDKPFVAVCFFWPPRKSLNALGKGEAHKCSKLNALRSAFPIGGSAPEERVLMRSGEKKKIFYGI